MFFFEENLEIVKNNLEHLHTYVRYARRENSNFDQRKWISVGSRVQRSLFANYLRL